MINDTESFILNGANRIFEPTVSIFNKGLVISYKKVGTRFLRTVASGGVELCDTDNKQIDFIISREPIIDPSKSIGNKINYKFSSRYITAPWHTEDKLAQSFPRWKNDTDFLRDMGVKSYTELFFENEKDIIFVVRNPLERFFSGVIQCTSAYFYMLQELPDEYDFYKEATGFSDDVIKIFSHLYRNTQFNDSQLLHSLPIEFIISTYKYMLHRRWHLLTSDIHVQPYLVHFSELMHNIKDTSKIKIVDLKHMRSEKSIKFLSDIYENKEEGIYREHAEHVIRQSKMETNYAISRKLADAYVNGEFITKASGVEIDFIETYIQHEYALYNELISSSHFINLED